MTHERNARAAPVYDVVGLGFGPSNLALAIALAEKHPGRMRAVFIEKKERFGWHEGLLVDDAMMQVSFLKDLATLRNPTSKFSFLSYLHDKGRLIDFVNHKSLFPSRVEFHDYLEWAAASFADQVVGGREAIDVRPVHVDSQVHHWEAITAGGSSPGRPEPEPASYLARNIVLATGLAPALPAGIERSGRIWHSAELLHRASDITDRPDQRFAVVGAGQSAAEVTAYVHQRFSDAQVYVIMSRYGYSPADDSSFANRVFDPAAVDDFFNASPEVKRMLYGYHANTNYSVVDVDLISELYRRYYQEKVHGRRRLHLLNMTAVAAVDQGKDRVSLKLQSLRTDAMTSLDVDFLIYATGYQPMDVVTLLGEASRYCEFDEAGRVRVGRDYRVHTVPGVQPGIYLQGGVEHSHGLSASLLSNVAVRAGEIADSIATRMAADGTRDRQSGKDGGRHD